MSNLLVIPNRRSDISLLLSKDIRGILLGVKGLSIYPLELDIEDIIGIRDKVDKKVYIVINRMIHNMDLVLVRMVLNRVSMSSIDGIVFSDLGVFNIIREMNIDTELIIDIEHQNASINSNIFYYNRGIKSSIVTNDITTSEVMDIKKNTLMNIYYVVYGYLPVFYSRRSLITNYFSYIERDCDSSRYYIYNNDLKYMVVEKDYGTIIYSPLVNMINEIDRMDDIDNLIINLSYVDDVSIIDKFINREKMDDTYIGFGNTKTIYKLKGDSDE